MRVVGWAALMMGGAFVGCGSDSPAGDAGSDTAGDSAVEDGDTADLDGAGPDAVESDGAGPDAADDTAEDTVVAVGVPVLLSVEVVVHGTIELTWQNPTSGCDTITIEGNRNSGAYAVAETVTGEATSATHEPGHASGTYCYRLLCNLGDMVSEPSNEQCAAQ